MKRSQREVIMPTKSANEEYLIEEAKRLGGHKSRKAAVNAALEAYVRLQKQSEIISHFGTIDFDETYDYKAERNSKRVS
jgi:hypothetical protein